jgi:hypothetical protein
VLLLAATTLAATPVAEAGLGVMAYVGDTVILNGSASADPDGAPLTYTWSQRSGPPVDLLKADTVAPEFEVTAPGTLRFTLVVNDGTENSPGDEVAVVVPDREALPAEDDTGGCNSGGPGPVGLWSGALCLVGMWRRRS